MMTGREDEMAYGNGQTKRTPLLVLIFHHMRRENNFSYQYVCEMVVPAPFIDSLPAKSGDIPSSTEAQR